MRKLITAGLCVLLIAGLALVISGSDSFEIFKQHKYPRTAGDRFWLSGTGTVTSTDSDTLLTTGSFLSQKFDMTTTALRDYKLKIEDGNHSISANRLVWFGEVLGLTDETAFCDSITVKVVWYNAAGDSGFSPADTIAFDTSEVVMAQSSRWFFMHQIDIEDKKGENVTAYTIALLIKSIDTTTDDTLVIDDCGVIRYYTD